MLKTFRHKGLKRLFDSDDPSGVRTDQVRRSRGVLAHLDLARHPGDLDLPGYREEADNAHEEPTAPKPLRQGRLP